MTSTGSRPTAHRRTAAGWSLSLCKDQRLPGEDGRVLGFVPQVAEALRQRVTDLFDLAFGDVPREHPEHRPARLVGIDRPRVAQPFGDLGHEILAAPELARHVPGL